MFDTTEVLVDGQNLLVAVADTPVKRSQGLMEVEDLGELDGMLFLFPEPTSPSFHMRNTPIPLDVWWFDEAGILIGSTEMEPCLTESCTSYRSPGPVMWVLETPQGVEQFEPGSALSASG